LIIRNGGGNKGIKEYLEEGRKVDRHMSRDELDKRIPIEGDLIVTQAVIDTIPDNKQERYLHITMSFNEPDVDEDKMMEVYQQYKKELMHAYGDDEFNIYAEIHWPKVKESYNFKTEVMEPRFPHVHIVIPKKNLLTGGFLNPLGMHEKSLKYIDAIQEKLNRANGLSSPRESPRVGFNHYETALGKYKDKEFASKNGEVKRDIHNALVARDIRSLEKFEQLLNEFGEVKVRNAGKPTQYFAIKISGDQKFTNLKGNLFTPEYIKDRSLVIDPITDEQIEKRLESWRSIQSLEIKYVSNTSAKVKEKYRNFTLPERRAYLIERENSYDGRYRKPNEADRKRAGLPSLPERNNQPGDFEFAARRPAERASYLHELRASNVDHFRSEGDSADRLFLSGNEDNDIFDLPANGRIGLRRDLYVGGSGGGSGSSGSSQAGLTVPLVLSDPQSSVLSSLLQAEEDKNNQQRDLERFAEIRKKLDPLHLLAYAQLKFGVDPENHLVSKAKDGSARIKVGKFNYNVSDFLTKHIGLEWAEASSVLTELYEKQQNGITDRPKAKVILMEDWRRFREDVYPKNIKTYDQLKNQIRVSFDLGLKAINAEYFARKKSITKDQTLTRTDKHYFRSVVILEKLQKIEALQQRIEDQKNLSSRIKYPYSTLFYDYATKNEEISMKILDSLKKRYQDPVEESVNVIGGRRPMTPQDLPNGAEAVKRARLVAKLHAKERENKELKIKLGDLRPRPQQDGSVVFSHKDNGQRIFVNHPDRLEMNRKTEPDEVGVGLMFALERFGNPLEIGGSKEFKEQLILVAAERDMDITFTDESLNRALEAKRLELGLDPLVGNTITVPEPELDRTLPLNEAVDQALLASKVAELNAVNNQLPYSMAEQAIHTDMLAEAVARHEEVESGFIDNDRIEQIAKEDLEAFVYLQNKPEQQPLAISMGTAMQNDVYSSYVDQHGPQELKLTIDAAQVVAAQQPAAQQPESQVRFIRPDMATALEQNQRLERPATERELENFTNWPDAISMSARLHQDYDLEPRSPEYSRNVAAIAIEASAYVEANPAGQDELFGKDRAFHQGELAKDMGRLMGQNEDYRSYVENHAPQVLLARIEQAAAPAEEQRPAAPEPLTFTHNGEPATIDLNRFQPQPQAEQPAPVEAPRPAAPEPLTFTHNGEPATIDLEPFQPQPQAEQPAPVEAPRPAAPEPLTFTHNGEPATIDLERFQQQPQAEQPAPVEVPRPAAPEPLTFTHNGEPATIDLERFQPQAELDRRGQLTNDEKQVEDLAVNDPERLAELRTQHDLAAAERNQQRAAVWEGREQASVEVERPAAPEPLNFTHNGEPATIDLERFKSPAELERRGHLSNDEKLAEDQAVNNPERLAELRTQHDLAAAERNQQRAAAWEGREQAQPAVQLTPAVAARVIELREVNNAFAKADPEQVYDDIVRKGTLADANMRHDELDSGFVDSDKIREIASEDLKAFGYLEGKPEQQALALSMGRAMENEHYSAYMADNAPESVGITIEASAVVSNEQQTMAPTEIESPSDKDMEL